MKALPGDPLRLVTTGEDGQIAAIVADYVRGDETRRMSMFLYHRDLRDLFDRLERERHPVPSLPHHPPLARRQCLLRRLLAAVASLTRCRQPPILCAKGGRDVS